MRRSVRAKAVVSASACEPQYARGVAAPGTPWRAHAHMRILCGGCQYNQRAGTCDEQYACLFFHFSPFSAIQARSLSCCICIVESDANYGPRWVFIKQRGRRITPWRCWWYYERAVSGAAGTE
jgi:hypothetical protein